MSHPIARIWKAGYRDLVSVVPPDAPISPHSKFRPESRGKAPGIRRGDGFWSGYNFLKADRPSGKEVAGWVNDGANVGMLAARFPGLDIDCEDPSLAALIEQEALKVLGPAPVRTSRPPRKLLVYRTDEPFSRMAATITFNGRTHTVEVLSAGRQYVIYGAHPSGTTYGWEEPLWDTTPGDLTVVDSDAIREFFAHLSTVLDGRATVEVVGDGGLADDKAPPQELLEAPSFEALADDGETKSDTDTDTDEDRKHDGDDD